MIRHISVIFLSAFLFLCPLLLPAGAETYVSLNDPLGTAKVNDQPVAFTYGTTAHAAWIAADNASGPFTLRYAAFNAASDFRNLALTRDTAGFFRIPPMTVSDNTGTGDNVVDVRRPWIGMLSGNRVVIVFQGKGPADTAWGLFRATFTTSGSSITGNVDVRRISGIASQEATFPSAALSAKDNTIRLAYAFDNGVLPGRRAVQYARVGVENAAVVATPVTLTSWDLSTGKNEGVLPLPSLSLDPKDRSHVTWVAEGEGAESVLSGVWYAMVAVTNGTDNLQIAATNVIGRNRSWSRPQAHAFEETKVYVTAADNSAYPFASSLSLVYLNPNEAPRDGRPVRISENGKFVRTPPGVTIYPSGLDLYRPTATVDKGGRVFYAGYGSSSSPVTYFVVNPLAVPEPVAITSPTPAGFGTPYLAASLDTDFTYPAVAYYSDRAYLFWSGLDNTDGERRNLNVTSVLTTKQWVDVDESGCSAAGHGAPVGLPVALALAIPFLYRALRARRKGMGGRG